MGSLNVPVEDDKQQSICQRTCSRFPYTLPSYEINCPLPWFLTGCHLQEVPADNLNVIPQSAVPGRVSIFKETELSFPSTPGHRPFDFTQDSQGLCSFTDKSYNYISASYLARYDLVGDAVSRGLFYQPIHSSSLLYQHAPQSQSPFPSCFHINRCPCINPRPYQRPHSSLSCISLSRIPLSFIPLGRWLDGIRSCEGWPSPIHQRDAVVVYEHPQVFLPLRLHSSPLIPLLLHPLAIILVPGQLHT